MASILQRAVGRLRNIRHQLQYPVSSLPLYLSQVTGRAGLEIGGPSAVFRPKNALPLYDAVGSLDNCDFSANTVWADHAQDFVYSPTRPLGRSFFCEGSNLTPSPTTPTTSCSPVITSSTSPIP